MDFNFSKMTAVSMAVLAAVTSCSKPAAEEAPATGAVATGVYHNLFTEVCGIPDEDVQQRIDSLWKHYFTPGDFSKYDDPDQTSVYYLVGDSMAYIYDVGSRDVRTEGMSYGMMISVQLDHREEFDRLWRWTKKYMAFDDPAMDGYFCWHCLADGTKLPGHNASDGEIYFATALLMAAHRWNEPRYEEEAQELLRKFYDKDPSTGIYPLYDRETKLPCFVPNEDVHWFSDPSYALPAFLEIWADRSKTNAEFWREAAKANRDLLANASHPETGLFPDYCLMDGTPYHWPGAGYNTSRFMYDAIRCAMNVGMDAHWYGKDTPRQRDMMRRFFFFLRDDNYRHGYFDHDGSNPDGMIAESVLGANAVGAFALLDSEEQADQEILHLTIQAFWWQNFPSGHWRYYNGLVFTLAMLHVSGRFRAY